MSRSTGWAGTGIGGLVAIAIACSGKTTTTTSTSSECDRFFDSLFKVCTRLPPPADEVARIRSRYEQVCGSGLSLPGVNLSGAALTSCVDAVATGGCGIALSGGSVCTVPGALPGGAACSDGLQCESLSCDMPSSNFPDGGLVIPSCGTCVPALAVGQSCNQGTPGRCLVGSVCDPVMMTCVAAQPGEVGASCTGFSCKAGLFCDPATKTCAPLLTAGAACQAPGNILGDPCAYPLVCTGTPNATCQNLGQAGAPCPFGDQDCAQGLACSAAGASQLPQGPVPHQCASVTWAAAGQPCGDLVHCLVGDCTNNRTCPRVIPDGKPCDDSDPSARCDTFASCRDGICSLGEVACH